MDKLFKNKLILFQEKYKQFFEDNKITIWEYFNFASNPPSIIYDKLKFVPFNEDMLFEFNNIITQR